LPFGISIFFTETEKLSNE